MKLRQSSANEVRGAMRTSRKTIRRNTWFGRMTVAAVAVLMASGASASIYVDVPGIPGDSNDKDHRDQIDAVAAGGTFTANRCGRYVVTKRLDKATPALIAATVSGRAFPQIVVEQTVSFTDSGRVPLSTITLNNARIVRVETNMDAAEPVTEVLKIRATSIDLEYNEYDSRGSLRTTIAETVTCGQSFGK